MRPNKNCLQVYPSAKQAFPEPSLYRKLLLLDDQCVPTVRDEGYYSLNRPNNGYGMRLTRLHDLRAENTKDAKLLSEFYPTARSFVSRVLYLMGLLYASGIVHGTRVLPVVKY